MPARVLPRALTFPLNPDQVVSICTPEGAAGGRAAAGAGQPKKSSFASVGAAFTRSLGALMQTLHACEGSHFVRCVKPNPELLPLKLHGESVSNQLRMSGMLDAVKLIQAGYPTRIPYDIIHANYAAVMPEEAR